MSLFLLKSKYNWLPLRWALEMVTAEELFLLVTVLLGQVHMPFKIFYQIATVLWVL